MLLEEMEGASFSLPDLRGKFAMGQGTCLGSNHEWKVGTSTGSETCTLTEKELPSHSHLTTFTPGVISRKGSLVATTEEATSDVPVTGAFLAKSIEVGSGKDDLIYKSKPSENSFVELSGINIGFYGGVPSGKVIVDDMGFNQAFHILQPGLVVSYLIAMEGLFPSRS